MDFFVHRFLGDWYVRCFDSSRNTAFTVGCDNPTYESNSFDSRAAAERRLEVVKARHENGEELRLI